ncbi:hypothetical protein KO502_15830 [Colwellia sp. E2M01]|nr:hypothetical protein [Colwellia sp. E2M01]
MAKAASNSETPSQYILQKIAQAPQLTSGQSEWLLLEKSGNNQHYYLANKQGEIYQLDQFDTSNTSLLLDLKRLSKKKSITKLTAFTLHPNFSLRAQEGYGTFYTAHIEKSTSNNANRLYEPLLKQKVNYDAVITEWQLTLSKRVNLSSQREILKVAIPTDHSGINQLSFNPYSTSWDENFSQLYIAIDQHSALKEYPLYSGVILRIHPKKMSFASYNIPQDNPFIGHAAIEKSIYLLGAGTIQKFIWSDKHSNKLLVSHQYTNSDSNNTANVQSLSYAYGGEDWRQQTPNQILYENINHNLQTSSPIKNTAYFDNNLLTYQGESVPNLRNKLLFLTQTDDQWQLRSLARNANMVRTEQPEADSALAVEWHIPATDLNTKQLSLYRDNRGELLFFNEASGAIYQLFQSDKTAKPYQEQATQQSSFGGIALFFIILSALLSGFVFYQVKVQKRSAKSLVRREYTGITLTDDTLALNLFRYHQEKAETVLELVDIHQCQILIGDNTVATLSANSNYGFDNPQEQALRSQFHNEQVAKMVDGKVRRISLILHTSDQDSYVVCLYLRKGSDRLTKHSYFEVVDNVIDWCWYFSKQFNSEQTGQRIIKPKLTADDIAKAEHKTHDDTPLHAQAAKVRPLIKPERANNNAKQLTNDEYYKTPKTTDSAPVDVNDKKAETEQSEHTSQALAHEETQLVCDLEKLIELKQQGFLTAKEFNQAKASLLNAVKVNVIKDESGKIDKEI